MHRLLAWWPQRLLLNRADAVVTVSETTRALMLEHRLTRRAITVVPNAAERPAGVEPRIPHAPNSGLLCRVCPSSAQGDAGSTALKQPG